MRATALSFVLVPLMVVAACGGDDTAAPTTPTADAGADGAPANGASDAGPTQDSAPSDTDGAPPDGDGGATLGKVPPAAGPANAVDGTSDLVFAISKYYFGDTDPDGTPDAPNGWTNYGYNLDGRISTVDSTDLCQTVDGARPRDVYPDADGGIDNSFGKHIFPGLATLSSFTNINSDITTVGQAAGTSIFNLGKVGSQSSYNPVPATSYIGGVLGTAPKFDGTDAWPVISPTSIPGGYIVDNTWVSGPTDFLLGFGNDRIVIHHAVITMPLDAGHHHVMHGQIAGIITVTELRAALKYSVDLENTSFCGDSTIFDSSFEVDAQAADIMADGTQDPTKTCDGISIGIGFDAELVKVGTTLATPTLTPDPCIALAACTAALPTQDTCSSCLEAHCCTEVAACGGVTGCIDCVLGKTTTGCFDIPEFRAVETCKNAAANNCSACTSPTDCDPVGSGGCLPGTKCDVDTGGSFACVSLISDAPQAACDACGGPTTQCGPGLTCTAAGHCTPLCCGDSDCGTGGACHIDGTLPEGVGYCLQTDGTESCHAPASPPSTGSCFKP